MIALNICFTDKNLSHAAEHEIGLSLVGELLSAFVPSLTSPEFAKTDRGKPYIKNSCAAYSVSHTRGCVMCALSAPGEFTCKIPPMPPVITDSGIYSVSDETFSDIGCDCEAVDRKKSRDWFMRIGGRFFTEEEISCICTCDDTAAAFYGIWTVKEAAVKCTGEGLGGITKNADSLSSQNKLFRFTLKNSDSLYCGAICGKV